MKGHKEFQTVEGVTGSYECTVSAQERPYTSRPSRTQQLQDPNLRPKLTTDVPNELLGSRGVADEILARRGEERGRKRELGDSDPFDDGHHAPKRIDRIQSRRHGMKFILKVGGETEHNQCRRLNRNQERDDTGTHYPTIRTLLTLPVGDSALDRGNGRQTGTQDEGVGNLALTSVVELGTSLKTAAGGVGHEA
ncbi:hypothetical protein IFM51744_06497 [Aspergillus udagawae]|nr:hypothetical protein IFM51744_06497 [Aspergillus udagawae]GFG19348.1 hypothetical protein IFM5058_09982 [Aspergillus udagawae]